MNSPEDWYEILQVHPAAHQDVIKAARDRLAHLYHPDKNPSPEAAEMMKRLNLAYEILGNPEKRATYDESRAWGRSSQVDDDMVRPAPTQYEVTVTLEEAYTGAFRLLDLPGGRRLEVKIPPGVDNGSRVRIPPSVARRESIYLVISVLPHPLFRREGRDLNWELELDFENANQGGEVIIPTIRGQVAMIIPSRTQDGRCFRLSGQGMPTLENPSVKGDLYVRVKVKQPPRTRHIEPEDIGRIDQASGSYNRNGQSPTRAQVFVGLVLLTSIFGSIVLFIITSAF